MTNLLSLLEVALELRVSRYAVWRWVTAGKLRAFRAGGQWRVHRSDLKLFIKYNREVQQ